MDWNHKQAQDTNDSTAGWWTTPGSSSLTLPHASRGSMNICIPSFLVSQSTTGWSESTPGANPYFLLQNFELSYLQVLKLRCKKKKFIWQKSYSACWIHRYSTATSELQERQVPADSIRRWNPSCSFQNKSKQQNTPYRAVLNVKKMEKGLFRRPSCSVLMKSHF